MDVQCGRRQKEALLSKITENTESEVDEGVVDTTEELYKLKAASTEFMSIVTGNRYLYHRRRYDYRYR